MHADRPPIVNILGDAIALGPQRRDLMPLYELWLNDFEVQGPLGATRRPITREAEEQLFAETDAAGHQVWFTLYERAALRPIGITGLRDIDRAQGTAEFVIAIGAKDAWGHGYGTEAAALILEYGFTALGLRAIMLRVFSTNLRGIRAYRRAGFREIGRRRWAHRTGPAVTDVIFMDCLAGEFDSPARGRVLH